MRKFLAAVVVLLWATSASAFVSRLHPNGENQGLIPCNSMWAATVLYIQGIYTAGQLASHLETRYLTPEGVSWSAEDNTDNANLKAKIDGTTGVSAKQLVALTLSAVCIGWEDALPGFETDPKNAFRVAVGLPTQ